MRAATTTPTGRRSGAGAGSWSSASKPKSSNDARSASGEVRLGRSGDSHFYADTEIDGTNIRMMVDSGASIIALTRRDAEAIGIDVDGLPVSGTARTAGGEVPMRTVMLDSVEIDGIEVRRVEAAVVDADMGVSLLGQSFLSKLDAVNARRRHDDAALIAAPSVAFWRVYSRRAACAGFPGCGAIPAGSSSHGCRSSDHTACSGAGKSGSANAPAATPTRWGRRSGSHQSDDPHSGQKWKETSKPLADVRLNALATPAVTATSARGKKCGNAEDRAGSSLAVEAMAKRDLGRLACATEHKLAAMTGGVPFHRPRHYHPASPIQRAWTCLRRRFSPHRAP